ncbi:MAG TPA: inorganic phosphate transporter [Candidatus Polarisedimenticolia bacterium]|jgi:PiT family inorganic phosphate transporter|nr:inorganic phosphate transporter [Candidatus Polarisedimenticolia bacterium]
MLPTLVLVVIGLALLFDFLNGFHDAANSIATVVTTRVLSPMQAVAWAAFFNFVAAFGFGTAVAKTIGKGLIDVSAVDTRVILAGLLGAIVWDILTWWWGLPTSSSHALIGGYAGAGIAKAGFQVLVAAGWIKTLLFIVLAPCIGLSLGYLLMISILWLCRRASPARVDKLFRRLQLVSAACYSLGHGTNDAQKTMGIISSLLFSAGFLREFSIPFQVILLCHAVIALGTMFGGWRIVRTMGQRITKLKPVGGFCAETAGAVTLLGTALWGIPVSTTHTITGAIMGVGATHRLSAVRWGVANRIVWAWILTIPAAAAVSMLAYHVLPFGGN